MWWKAYIHLGGTRPLDVTTGSILKRLVVAIEHRGDGATGSNRNVPETNVPETNVPETRAWCRNTVCQGFPGEHSRAFLPS